MPTPGLTDANRNCISNVRTEGLSYEEAAARVHYLVKQMHKLQLSGVILKDESTREGGLAKEAGSNFLLEPRASS